MQKRKCDALINHLKLMGLDVPLAKRKPGVWELEPSGKKHKGSTDIVETKDDLANMPRMLEQLCKDVGKYHLEVVVKPEPPKGLDKSYETSTSLTSGIVHCKYLEPLDRRETINSSSTSDCSKAKSVLSSADIASLDADNFVDDPVINWAFEDLMQNLNHNGIHDVLLMDPTMSHIFAFDPDDTAGTSAAHSLSSKRLVMIPVNNNTNPDQYGGGTHWSLIVFDQWTHYGPRLLHYDSAGSLNFKIAHKLSTMLQHHLPIGTTKLVPARTPQQGYDNTSALFVIAIARCICDWCKRATAGGQEADWNLKLFMEIDIEKVAKLRIELHKKAQGQSLKTPL
jgi:sentrin-specific protease 8